MWCVDDGRVLEGVVVGFVVVVVEWLGSLWFRSLFRFRYGGFVVVEECNVRLRFFGVFEGNWVFSFGFRVVEDFELLVVW